MCRMKRHIRAFGSSGPVIRKANQPSPLPVFRQVYSIPLRVPDSAREEFEPAREGCSSIAAIFLRLCTKPLLSERNAEFVSIFPWFNSPNRGGIFPGTDIAGAVCIL
jgi:hypothetical protein